MRTTGMGRVRLRAALCAVALAIVGSAVMAGPARAAAPDRTTADGGEHCALVLPDTEVLRCFASHEDARRFAVEVGAIEGHDQRASAANQLPPRLTLLSVEYASAFYLGDSLWVYGEDGPCTPVTTDLDYELSSMPAGWNNRITSFLSSSNCQTRHYDYVNFGGIYVGYSPSQLALGNGLDNDTSSLRWS